MHFDKKLILPLFLLLLFLGYYFIFPDIFKRRDIIEPIPERINPELMKGIVLGLHSKDYHFDYFNLLKEIKSTGAEWVGINVKFFQDCASSTHIQRPPLTDPFWQQINRTMKQAKVLDLKIMFLPIVLIEHPQKKEWRGLLAPYDKNEWYESYHELFEIIGHICENNQVDLLSVGSEFNSLQIDQKKWIEVIRNIKKIYSGKITYSCNWDVIDDIYFTDELDYLGITGYNSLTKKNNPSLGELQQAWDKIKKEILRVQKEKNIPVFFTEVGYTSQNGTNKDPWNYNISQQVDLEEQYDCYLTFINAWRNEPEFHGVFFYDWFGIGGKKDIGYTLRGKPALSLVKQWYSENKNQKNEN